MRIRNSISPYPILFDYRDDYIGSSFRANIEAAEKFNDVNIHVQFILQDDMIKQLIQENKAAYMVHIECPTLSLRKRYECSDEDFDIFINMSELGSTIEICTFIVTSEDLKGYSNPHFHPDYSSVPGFDLKKGQVLAIGTSKIFDVEKTGDSLASLPSIIQVVKSGEKQKDAITVSTDSNDHITIGLRDEVFELYARLGKKQFTKTSLSLVLVPALMTVLQRMKEQEEDLSECKWFGVIEGILEQNGIAVQDLTCDGGNLSYLSVAQSIFSDPVARSLAELRDTVAGGE